MGAEMACKVCGWWPPITKAKDDHTEQASDGWRWKQLREHIEDQAIVEIEDGRPDGAHVLLDDELDRRPEEARRV